MNQLNLRSSENKLSASYVEEVPIFPPEWSTLDEPLQVFEAEGIVGAQESDLFARHDEIPAHEQELFRQSRIVCIGGGGLNSAVALALVRGGARCLTIIDHDRAEVSNLSRQFFFREDLGLPKGIRLAKNLQSHAIAGGTITGIDLPFEEAIEEYPLPADIYVVGVDNNTCRLKAVREARRKRIPATFSMLSVDGMRGRVFLQGPSPLDPCLWCALPDLDPEGSMPCVSAVISACFMVAAHTVFFVHRALMGWGKLEPFNWREIDLTGSSPERIGLVKKRPDCPVCKEL
jgi:molybdopterin/thiamine biosynthesis adenylyltransferase